MLVCTDLQKDFSVTNRLLPQYNETKDSSKSHNADNYACYPHGWQYLLPTDQGSVSTSRPGWQGIVPNATLSKPPFELQNLKADTSSSYANASGYCLVQHHHTQNSAVEHMTQLPGATTPLHHVTDIKENSLAPTSPDSDPQGTVKQIPVTRSSSTGEMNVNNNYVYSKFYTSR